MKTTFARTTTWFRLLFILGFLPLVLPSVAQAENTVHLGVVGGERTAFSSEVRFDSTITVDGALYQIGTAVLTIDDSSGTNAGWQLTIGLPDQSSFREPGDMILIGVSAPIRVSGQEIDQTSGPIAPASTLLGDLHTHRTTLMAAPGFGKGAYQQKITVAQPVPSDGSALPTSVALTVTILPVS